jgi:hypothetical protein
MYTSDSSVLSPLWRDSGYVLPEAFRRTTWLPFAGPLNDRDAGALEGFGDFAEPSRHGPRVRASGR